MPELPEVEIVRRGLELQIKNKTIKSVQVLYPKIIKTPSDIKQFQWMLEGETIQSIDRKGKYLIFHTDRLALISHLRMEGKYIFNEEHPTVFDKHTHVLFFFTDGSVLQYRDVRKFGTMDLLAKEEANEFPKLKKLGQEPICLEFSADRFIQEVQSRHAPIKQLLLNQEIVSGLGNIYADETLALSKIHPLRSGSSLSDEEITQIIASMKTVLEKAIEKGGSTIRSYESFYGKGSMQEHFRIYGRTGKPCMTCGTPIEKIRVGGRGTHFCPICQKNDL